MNLIKTAVLIMLLSACSKNGEFVNVYSGRHYQADEKVFRKFTQQTGIQVNLLKANSDQLINRIKMEGSRSPADLIITADAGRLIHAHEKGLLQPIHSVIVDSIVPSHLRDQQNYWVGFTKRARVIIYSKERVNPTDLDSYEDLTSPGWENRILVRSSQNHYNQTLMASMVAALGSEESTQWALGLVRNMARNPVGNDRDQIKGIAAGIGDIAIANTYYIGLMLNSVNQEERQIAAQMGIFFPNQNNRGTHINISGIGVATHSPNYNNAVGLIEFMIDEAAQQVFADENHEYPVNPNVEWPDLLKEWGQFKSDTIPLYQLGQYIHESMIIFNKAGWD